MPDYELRYLDDSGAVRARHAFAASDDATALDLSQDAAGEGSAELWRGAVRLATFDGASVDAERSSGARKPSG